MLTLTTATARDRYARKNEEEDLRRAFQTLDIDQDHRLSLSDLTLYLSSLDNYISKNDTSKRDMILDMIWEVDDDCDGFVDWEEFQKMYERCRNDDGGNEPRSLFNIALFAMHATSTSDGDRNDGRSCVIRADDLYKMMYFKAGADGVETQMNDVFQLHDVNSGRVVKIQEFLTCLERQLVEQRQQMSTVSSSSSNRGGGKKHGSGVIVGRR